MSLTGRLKQGFRVELAPTAEQLAAMGRHAGLSRFVENFALDKIRAAFAQRAAEQTYGIPQAQQTKAPWSAIDLEKLWRAEHAVVAPWFAESGLSSRIPKEACRLRAAGLKNWWDSKTGKRKGPKLKFPTMRRRKHGSRFRYDADRAKPSSGTTVSLPGVPGKVTTREPLDWLTDRLGDGRARIIGCTVRERAGRWWVTFQLDIDRTDVNERRTVDPDAPTCGIDLGLKTFAVIADDTGAVEEVQAPRALKAAQRRLRRANKALARTRLGSKNRAKARQKVAEVHLKVAHRRQDFLHQLTTRLARSKRAIAVESLNVSGMVRNRRLARAVSDAGFGEFVRQLTYKADWYGSKVWAAGRWFPSSKTCGDCGVINAGLTLSDRSWACPCGAVHDRDHNAARNLLAAMHAA
ncbi:RNA-guided endonuclease InsQ/TnpB family protein [Micromonospora sediminicola]|uniref:RNA-guided endonuclease InsQ/TnpB family protein n=1 Tax=Micromonospora sediminicola TaxID=946078 RepID=UPI0037B79E59